MSSSSDEDEGSVDLEKDGELQLHDQAMTTTTIIPKSIIHYPSRPLGYKR